ncbi:MAG: DUF3352 domain-containing protein [Candidatus Aminicenantaceae bacterium]
MKKVSIIGISIIFVVFSFISCGKKAKAPEAGSASPEDMLSMLPADLTGVIVIDAHRAMTTKMVSDFIEKDENYKEYQEFIDKTGLDPQKDIYFLAVGISENIKEEDEEYVYGGKTKVGAVLNLKYDKESLLALIKEKQEEEEKKELIEEQYKGFTLYTPEDEDEDFMMAFLDESNMALGTADGIKSVIDVYQKEAANVFKNENLYALISDVNRKAMVWGAFTLSEIRKETMVKDNPMFQALKGVSSIAMFFDYKNANLSAEIKVNSIDETKNKKVVEFLIGIKSFGAMAAEENPEIGEIINKIEITSGTDHVKVSANIPEELLQKLKAESESESETETETEIKKDK